MAVSRHRLKIGQCLLHLLWQPGLVSAVHFKGNLGTMRHESFARVYSYRQLSLETQTSSSQLTSVHFPLLVFPSLEEKFSNETPD